MFGFDFGKNVFLGIDIGTSAIKIVELSISSGKPTLSNYAWMPIKVPFDSNGMKTNNLEVPFAEYLKKIIKEAGFRSQNAFISIPAFGGLITLIDFPEMDRKDMDQAIRFEAHKYIPSSLDDVILSWDIVDDKKAADNSGPGSGGSSSSSKIKVLLVAASKSKVAKYENLIKNTGLELRAIELESFSMVRSLVGNDPGNFIVVDIGSRICNIMLVENGTIRINRNIDAGGKDITRTIAKSIGLDEERAESMKLSSKNFFTKESYINFPPLEMILDEIARIISNLNQEDKAMKIDGVILSGGTAKLAGIDGYFSDMLKQKVIIGNPLSRVQYDRRLDPILGNQGIQFSVSIGLALKGISNYLKK